MKKRLLSCALAAIMVVAAEISPVSDYSFNESISANAYDSSELVYSDLNDGTVCIIMYYGGDKTYFTIPATHGGKSVTQIAGLTFSDHRSLTKITFPNTLKYIGREAFWNCSGLTSLTFPDSLKTIDEKAFLNCTGLKSVTLSDSISDISDNAFDGCSEDLVFYVNKGTYAESFVRYKGYKFKLLNHEHQYSEEILFEPTCEQEGLALYECAEGDDEYEEKIPALGHDYAEIEHEPSCTERGYTEHRCTRCGKSFIDNYTPVEPHEYDEVNVIEPTCTEKGYTEHKCVNCGISYKDSYEDALGHDYTYEIKKEPTCKANGIKTYSCKRCTYKYNESIDKIPHEFMVEEVYPTYESRGYNLHTCGVCGYSYKDNYVNKLKKISVSNAIISSVSNKTYTGKALTQTPVVKLNKKTLKKGSDYTVSYKNNKAVGTATVTITGKGAYQGTVSKTFKIVPKKSTVKKVTSPKTKQLKVTYNKVKGVTGYQVTYSTSKKFTKKTTKTVTVNGATNNSKTVKKLKKGKTYYVKVRTYKTVNGIKYYSGYSAVKKTKVK